MINDLSLSTTLNTTAKTVHGAINELKAGGGDVSIKYDSSDQYIYCKNSSGIWVKWIKAYIENVYNLIIEGSAQIPFDGSNYIFNTSGRLIKYCDFEEGAIVFNYNFTYDSFYGTLDAVNLTNYNYCDIEYSVNGGLRSTYSMNVDTLTSGYIVVGACSDGYPIAMVVTNKTNFPSNKISGDFISVRATSVFKVHNIRLRI